MHNALKKFSQLGETLVEPCQELQTLKTKGKHLRQSNKGSVQVCWEKNCTIVKRDHNIACSIYLAPLIINSYKHRLFFIIH